MTTKNEEVDTIVDDPYLLHLPEADVDVRVSKIRTREALKLIRILGAGAGPLLGDIRISADTNAEELAQEILGLLLFAITDAEDEVLDFFRVMVNPVDLIEPAKNKTQHEANVQKYTELYEKLQNPEIADTIALVSKIVENEAPNFLALGKQIAAMLPSAAKQTASSKKPSRKRTPAAS